MTIENKKRLAAKTLNVGLGRIKLNESRLDEIKEAITKQDIRDLQRDGAIIVKPIKGRRARIKRTTRTRAGKKKKIVNKRKQNYVRVTRKLRKYIKELKDQEKIENEKYKTLRKKIKMKEFKSKRHLKEHIA